MKESGEKKKLNGQAGKKLGKRKMKQETATAKKWMNINGIVAVLFIDLFIDGVLCRFLNTLFIVIVVACHVFFPSLPLILLGIVALAFTVAMYSVVHHVSTLSTHNVVKTLIHSLIWH